MADPPLLQRSEMSKRRNATSSETMLQLWRPPQGAGDPIGCLATTYTFTPGLFDEQCLARFLEIESEPNREDLAFLVERESRLGGVYAGVLVDHTQAGVEHSLRWDVLPVRVSTGKQHAKISLLVWSHHIRIIVASANLSEPGYRSNYEVAATINLTPEDANTGMLTDAIAFLRRLITLAPGAADRPAVVKRADSFLDQIESRARAWKPGGRNATIRQQLVFTIPGGTTEPSRSSLEETVEACRRRGGSPVEAWIASPFFDADAPTSRVTAALCKSMARGEHRELTFCVPAIRDKAESVPRLAAPYALIRTPPAYQASSTVEMLPETDTDKNLRPWHAKMLALRASAYSALMIGSSNFTCAGMGVGSFRNTEANIVTIVEIKKFGRESGQLESVWPEMDAVADPESAEWLGPRPDRDEDEQGTQTPLPAGFLLATYRAGDERKIVLRLKPDQLPDIWSVVACGSDQKELLASQDWKVRGSLAMVELVWKSVQPPDKLLVRWDEHEAFLPLNVEDSSCLPPPSQLDHMTADDMLWILAATDPSAAIRAWANRNQVTDLFEAGLDSATPTDLDPLKRYDLQATFLHRIRRRARILAQLRANLQRPVWGHQALEWRLRGIVGIEALADRLMREFANMIGAGDESLLTIADFVIVLNEVDYQPADGSLSKAEFNSVFRPFLTALAGKLGQDIAARGAHLSGDVMIFWNRVEERCRV